MAYKFGDLKWSEMTDKQRAKAGSKSDHKDAKRMAGDAIVQEAQQPPAEERKSPKSYMTAGAVDDINDFDRTAGGAGAQRGEDRLSAADLKNLDSQGFSKQDIIDYSERSVADGSKQGKRARNLLEKFKADLANAAPDVPAPKPEFTPVDPVAPAPDPKPAPTPTPTPAPTPSRPSNPFNPNQSSQVVQQVNQPDPFAPPSAPVNSNPNPNLGGNQDLQQSNQASVSQNQNQQNENNSTNTINGDYGYINNSQMNFGGDNNSMIIQKNYGNQTSGGGTGSGSSNEFGAKNLGSSNIQDTDVSDMAAYKSTDYDSPASTAAFAARHGAINDMLQGNNYVPNFAAQNIAARKSLNIGADTAALDRRIQERPMFSGARAALMGTLAYGDMYKYEAPKWQSGLGTGKAPDDPDLEGMYEGIIDDIKDVY